MSPRAVMITDLIHQSEKRPWHALTQRSFSRSPQSQCGVSEFPHSVSHVRAGQSTTSPLPRRQQNVARRQVSKALMRTTTVVIIMITLMVPNLARAGKVFVQWVKPFSCVGISAGGGAWSAGACDTDGDGTVVFTVPQAVQESAGAFSICKTVWDAG